MPPNNPMTTWGNEKTMNLNMLVLTNIQSSPYFKVNLFELKTYHEVIDEIYYRVTHLEPWEKGSRKTSGQTGMCGGVRGVGAGGIVSSAYCLLYKLFTLKLTKKQVIGLITHNDSPYIRGLGFMYIRYTQPPADLWAWFEDYLDDEEEIDVKAGGGHVITIGTMLRQWLVKLEWYATLFPRIPVPIEKDLAAKLKTRPPIYREPEPEPEHIPDNQLSFGEAEKRGGRDDRVDFPGREDYHGSRDRDFRGNSYREDTGRGGGRDTNVRDGRDNHNRDGRDNYSRDGRDNYSRDGRDSYSKDARDCYGRDGGSRGRSPIPRRPSPAPRYRRSPNLSSASRRSRSPLPRRERSPPRATSFERDLARERERQKLQHGSGGNDKERKKDKERKERRSGSRDRVSSHKRSHKDKHSHKDKDKHSHKNKEKHSDGHKSSHKSKSDERSRERR